MRALLLMLVLSVLVSGASAEVYGPRDWGGADVVLEDGDVIYGVHTGIRLFHVPEDATVTVLPYDGEDVFKGSLYVFAEEVLIEGTLDARAAGYTGGGGGGGTQNFFCTFTHCSDSSELTPPSDSGTGRYGEFRGSGQSGSSGDGPCFGQGSIPISPYSALIPGTRGGYLKNEENGDLTTNPFVFMGSGGGGDAGDFQGCQVVSIWSQMFWNFAGDGGGGGGIGGGCIALIATQDAFCSPTARLLANGSLGVQGGEGDDSDFHSRCPLQGGRGGDAMPPNLREVLPAWDRRTNGGAGGGILLICDTAGGLTIEPGATLSSLGGGGVVENGGTVKVFTRGGAPDLSAATVTAGRLFTRTLDDYEADYDGDGQTTPADAQALFYAWVEGRTLRDDGFGFLPGDAVADNVLTPADAQAAFERWLATSSSPDSKR